MNPFAVKVTPAAFVMLWDVVVGVPKFESNVIEIGVTVKLWLSWVAAS